MKKYTCSKCGFRNRLQVESIKRDKGNIHHKCKKCGSVVFPSDLVLQCMMRRYMKDNKLDFRI